MDDTVIVGAARTAVGGFLGGFSNVPAHQLGTAVVRAVLERSGISADEVDDLIFGQALTAGQGQNPARQTAILAGLPCESTAISINQVCGSGLRSVALASQQVMTGDAKVVLAGGQENMSMSPHLVHVRSGTKMGNLDLTDSMLKDGLLDAFNNYHMGNTAENLVEKWQITREMQDALAVVSQNRAEAAQKADKFVEEIVPVTVKTRKGPVVVDKDEHIRHGVTIDSLAKIPPAFKSDGSVTAGNSSGLNDGAAAVLLMSAKEASARGLSPLARIVSWATAGVEPSIMGIGAAAAAKLALKKAGLSLSDIDLFESNEAFAAQAIAVSIELGLDQDKVNVNGGAIALGHPIGASGARILVTLLHEMRRGKHKKGLATLCVGGGMGVAMILELV